MAQSWKVRPQLLDVVWCRFPEALESPGGPVPGPKPRPALVLDLDERTTPTYVRVAFGTSKKTDRLYGGEFQVAPTDGEVFTGTGCDGDTKFDLRRTVWLPFEDTWFTPKPNAKNSSPVMGRIDLEKNAQVTQRLREVVKRLAKEELPEPPRASSKPSK